MNKLLVLSLLLLCHHFTFAGKDENMMPANSGDFVSSRAGVFDTLRLSAYLPACVNMEGVLASDRPAMRSSSSTISLLINPEIVSDQNYEVILEGYYKRISPTQAGFRDSTRFTLNVNYAAAPGSKYKQRDAITIPNTVYTQVSVTVRVNGITLTDSLDKRFRVEVYITGDMVYPAPTSSVLSTDVPAFNITKEDVTARSIKWSWSPLPWAEHYELEYLHVDNYKADGTRRDRAALRYNFRTDAVRVRITGNEYELPLVFEQGYLVARVRGIGYKGERYNIPVNGRWSLADEGAIPATGNSVFEVLPDKAHEADRLNWQYQAGFNESGMRSEQVTYADGTLRQRQVVAAMPEENKLLVSETLYDHAGRTSINILPAPIKPAASTLKVAPFNPGGYTIGGPTGMAPGSLTLPSGSTGTSLQQVGGGINLSGTNFSNTLNTGFSLPTGISPLALNNLQSYLGNFELSNFLSLFYYRSQNARIGFVPRFNVNTSGGNILRSDYDIDLACDSTALALGTQSGAGRYYSPENPERSRWQAYVPDAEGYPYSQIKYTNDGTGKTREKSHPGYAHRIGGGHTQQLFYGTPSQAELDRYLGNDAGHSSFYRKTLMIDENGQGHVNIHSLKGNLILTGLTGAKPDNLVALTGVTTNNDVVNLIAENNVLNSAENAWESTKRLVLSAATDVQLDYSTTSPDYTGRYCNGASFCYDCVYDLQIEILNDCGTKVYEHSETIGTLDNINACTPATASAVNKTIRLQPGSYLVTKKLKVNAASIEAYVNNFKDRFTCRLDTLLFTPEFKEACGATCLTCDLINEGSLFRRRDGSNTALNYNKRKPGNNSDCQLACSQTQLGEVAAVFQTMLSEVSPGGQYAEYRDTARIEDRPAGVTNPAAFPLSVLNDANQLPLATANWRNPAYNYQTRTGEVAMVLVGEIGTPLHRSPPAEIVTRDGRQYVLVKYLNDVSDFIRLWEPQWAEALVVYHPEYEYYLWSAANSGSFRFDSLLSVTQKQSEAAARGLTDYRNDPFLPATATALRADMDARLANVGTVAGSSVTAAQMSILSVHCGNPNFSDAQFRDCYTTKALYGTAGAQDKEWLVYKGLYRKIKLRMVANERNRGITATGGFNNRSIGGTRDVAANSLYSGKRRVFREEDDITDELGLDFTGAEPTVSEIEELRQRVLRERYAGCGVCPVGSDMMMLLNALNYEKKLTAASVSLPGISPLTLTKNLVNSFSNNTALQYTYSRVSDPNPNILKVKITTGGVEMGTITLEKRLADIKWDSLLVLDCFKPTGEYTFTLRIISNDERIDSVRGRSTCFRLTGCTFPRTCTATPARREMLTFLQYLFETNRYKRTLLNVHTSTAHSPHFGAALRRTHPNGQAWQWAFDGFTSAANTAFNARLVINEGRGALMATPVTCNFTFTITTPGFNFDSIGFVIAVRKPASLSSSAAVNNAELMVRSRGGRIFYIAMTNSCYALFDCAGDLSNTPPRAGLCCTPPPRTGTIPNDCESSLRFIARREAERDFIVRRDAAVDSVRGAYVRHCLSAVRETYTLAYNDAMYMVTLYYYDLSGSLVKTVPPKGVRTLTSTQLAACDRHRQTGTGSAVYPEHNLETTYKYTSLGKVAERTAPDDGTTKYAYDYTGRSILTRDAVQAANGHASYIMYDANNRIIENGRTNFSGTWQTFKNYTEYAGTLTGKADIVTTLYDQPSTLTGSFAGGQKGLRNRPSSVSRKDLAGGADTYMAAYSYDALGHITRIAQYYPLPGVSAANNVKTTDYTFDVLSGKVTRIIYQQGKGDQFIHWLSYDAAKRLSKVQTSTSLLTPERLRDTDVKFNYYEHGPLARTELGSEKIQGIDYAYTIQGWLKGMNGYATGNGDIDMGRDGTTDGGLHAGGFPKDVTAELLNYFADDYKKIGNEGAPFYPEMPADALSSGFSKPLYNGSIQNSMMSVLQNFGSDTRRTFAQGYSYDQCNRLHESKNMFATGTGFDAAFSDQYRMAVDYDMNGNITTLTRTGNSATAFDDLTYHYTHADNNNRLDYITDIGTPGINDIKNQTSTSNYRYDVMGRLTADASESITGIEYNNQSKVTLVNKNGNITRYTYDAFGRRITKTSDNVTEWYVNDATGNTLAVYSITGSELRWKEAGIFGDKRIGLYKPNIVVDARNMMRDSLIRGYKSYQLANHTGDVLAVVSDRKYNTADGANAEVQAANNYYPFGMVMPARTIGNSEYRYGYQGMETEDNLRGENNSYTTEFRQYDPRLGRWMSVDPKADKYAGISAYTAFLNNPLIVTDPLGDDPPVKKTFEQSMNELPTTGNGEDDPIALGDELDFLFEEKTVEQEERPAPRIRTGRPPAPVDDQFLDAFFHNEISIPRWDGGPPEEVISFEDDPEHVTGNRAEAQEFINLLGPLQTADDYYSAIEQIRDPASIFGGLSETARSGMLWRLAVYARAGGFPQVARALVGGSRVLPIISAVATTTAMIDCIYENSTSSDPQIQGVGLHVRNGLCVAGGVVGVAIPFVQDPISNLLPTGRQQQDAVRQMIQENIEELRAR